MNTYIAKKQFRHDGQPVEVGQELQLADRQAKYLLLDEKIELKAVKKPAKKR